MHAALIVLAHMLTSSTPTPAPTQVVLDGCSTATAIRVAEIRLTSPESSQMRTLLGEVLGQADGAVCLVESDVLVGIARVGHDRDLVKQALAGGFAGVASSARAASVAARIRAFDPAIYDDVMRGGHGGWESFTTPTPSVVNR